jgi:hypothetical protein
MGYWLWAHRGPSTADANADADANAGANANANANASATGDSSTSTTTTTSTKTTHIDPAQRAELRKRIFEGMWRNAEPDAVPPAGGFAAPPPKAQELSSEYLHARLLEDYKPMARACFNELLSRKPGMGGKLLVKFTIVGDEKVGGIVESAELDPKSTIKDDKLETCIKESMLTMQFAPPDKGGTVTVVAPLTFVAADASGGDAEAGGK